MTERPKIERPTALQLLEPARLTREQVEEFAPMVVFAPRRGQPQMAVIEEEGPVRDVLAALLAQMRATLGPADWIAVTTDAYVKKYQEESAPAAIEPGELREGFFEGDPEVHEQMIVVVVDRYAGVDVASQDYRYLPSEGWEWGEPQSGVEVIRSSLADVLKFYM